MLGKVKLEKISRNKHGVNHIVISGLEDGLYQLRLKKEGVQITVKVHQGSYWNHSSDFLIKERSIIERTNQRIDCLRVEDVSISNVTSADSVDEKTDDKKIVQRIRVVLGGDYNIKKARVHAWAFKFFPYDFHSEITEKLSQKNSLSLFASTHFDFAHWKNIYLSNR